MPGDGAADARAGVVLAGEVARPWPGQVGTYAAVNSEKKSDDRLCGAGATAAQRTIAAIQRLIAWLTLSTGTVYAAQPHTTAKLAPPSLPTRRRRRR